jgi:hypothetical protein
MVAALLRAIRAACYASWPESRDSCAACHSQCAERLSGRARCYGDGAVRPLSCHAAPTASRSAFCRALCALSDIDHNSTGDYSFNVQEATFTVGSAAYTLTPGTSLPVNIFNGILSGSGSTFPGRVRNNSVTGTNNPGFDGITLDGTGPGTMTVLVDSNMEARSRASLIQRT